MMGIIEVSGLDTNMSRAWQIVSSKGCQRTFQWMVIRVEPSWVLSVVIQWRLVGYVDVFGKWWWSFCVNYWIMTPPSEIPNTMLSFPWTLTDSQEPWHYIIILWDPQLIPKTSDHHFNSYYSALVLLHSITNFISPSQSLPFCFRYIAPFQYSCSPVLASTLPLDISTSIPLNSYKPL